MKCPNCQRENYEGAKFCLHCGTPIPQPPSRARKFFVALLKALCYFGLFFGLQTVIIAFYEAALIFGEMSGGLIDSYLYGGEFILPESLYDTLTDQLQQNVHLLMILSAAVTLLFLFLFFQLRRKKPLEEIAFRSAPLSKMGMALLLGLALQFFVTITMAFLPIPEEMLESFAENNELLHGGHAAPAMLAAMLIFLVAFVIIFLTKIPEPHIETAEQRAAAKANKDQYSPLSFRHFVLGAIAIFFYVGVEVGIPNTANLYMSNNPAVGPAIAGTVVGLYWLMMMCGRLLGGAVGGKVSSKAMLVAVSSLAIVMLLCVMFFPETWVVTFKGIELPVSMIIMFLCGLMTSVMWGAIFNLAAEGLGKYTPAASGIFMALVCGGGILPFLQNLLADHSNYLISYIVPIAGLLYILFYALVGSKNVNKDIPTE